MHHTITQAILHINARIHTYIHIHHTCNRKIGEFTEASHHQISEKLVFGPSGSFGIRITYIQTLLKLYYIYTYLYMNVLRYMNGGFNIITDKRKYERQAHLCMKWVQILQITIKLSWYIVRIVICNWFMAL